MKRWDNLQTNHKIYNTHVDGRPCKCYFRGVANVSVGFIILFMVNEMLGPTRISLLEGLNGREYNGYAYNDGKPKELKGPVKNSWYFEREDGKVDIIIRLGWLAERNGDGVWQTKQLPSDDFEKAVGISFITGESISEQSIQFDDDGALNILGKRFV